MICVISTAHLPPEVPSRPLNFGKSPTLMVTFCAHCELRRRTSPTLSCKTSPAATSNCGQLAFTCTGMSSKHGFHFEAAAGDGIGASGEDSLVCASCRMG